MHYKIGNTTYLHSLFFLMAGFFFPCNIPTVVMSTQIPHENKLVTITEDQQSFNQVIASISEQTDVNIIFHGNQPDTTQNISFSNQTIDQALSRILRIFKIENHATIYNVNEKNILQIDLYGYTEKDSSNVYRYNNDAPAITDETALTMSEFDQLALQSNKIEDQFKKQSEPLTQEELDSLKEQSNRIEEEIKRNSAPLTQEEIEGLKNQSKILEQNFQEQSTPLTPAEMKQLQDQNSHIENEYQQ